MTDFVPFPTPPGSSGQGPLQLNGDTFTAGDVIKCSVTGSVGAVTGTVSDTETVIAPITPTPLPTQRTFLMEDAYNGGYAQAIADNPTTATSITWVLGRANYFPQTASNGETIDLDNDLSTQAKADAWAEVWTTWALDQLAAKVAAGLTVDGNPICLDPEDKGVDSAVSNVDWAYAKTASSSITTGSYSDARVGHTGTEYTTDVSVASPLALDAMDQGTRNVKAVYPNSPVGWYNTGIMVYLPGWRGADTNPVDGEGAHVEAVLNGLVTDDTNFYQWRALAQCDFGFTPWYQGVGNNVVNNLNDGTDNNIPGSGWMGYQPAQRPGPGCIWS